MNREEDQFMRSPYNYNQNHPGPSHPVGFPRPTQGHKRGPETNEAPEGGGTFRGKRKRT